MNEISSFMADDHKACDELFAAAEQLAADGDWAQAVPAHDRFMAAMATHFSREEEILFPAFEKASGMSSGPTEVMRYEHMQMRELFGAMQQALDSRDADAYLGATETLLMLMQQHNAKEERILYPMCDSTLAAEHAAIVAQLEGRSGAGA